MVNPWIELEKVTDGEVAKCDKMAIEKVVEESPEKLQIKYLPQPYMGDPTRAKIFLLNGNPNAPDDAKNNPGELSQEDFNINHRKVITDSYNVDSSINKEKDYPLYALNPDFEKYSIYRWWYDHLSCLIEAVGLKTVSEKLFAAEYFPYFSKKFPDFSKKQPYFSKNLNGDPILESQEYTFNLVKEAIEAEKIIVIMRAEKKWYNSVKGVKGLKDVECLEDYKNKKYKDVDGKEYSRVIVLKEPRFVYVFSGNMQSGDFRRILKILKGEEL